MIEPRQLRQAARSSSGRSHLDRAATEAGTQGDVRARRPRLPVQLPDPNSIADHVPVVQALTEQTLPDDQVAVRVHERLAELGALITGRMVIRVQEEMIVLHGTVQSPHERLLVMSCVQHVRPGMAIRDRLEIMPARVNRPERTLKTLLKRWLLKSIAAGSAALALVAILTVLFRYQAPERTLVEMPVTVQAAGSPAAGAFLTLHPLQAQAGRTPDAQNVRPQGRVADDGRVAWTTFQPGDGLPPGDYIVTATWSRLVEVYGEKQPGPNQLSQLYATADTSPLRLEVPGAFPITTEAVVLQFR